MSPLTQIANYFKNSHSILENALVLAMMILTVILIIKIMVALYDMWKRDPHYAIIVPTDEVDICMGHKRYLRLFNKMGIPFKSIRTGFLRRHVIYVPKDEVDTLVKKIKEYRENMNNS